ncbi:MAG: CDP-glycerol glycerophosphotransferase family protein [Clostridium sp.]
MRNKIEYLLKHNEIILTIYKKVFSFIFKVLGLFIPIKENLILFSANSQRYNDSPRAIYEKMKQDKELKDKYTYVWALDKPGEYEIPYNHIEIKADTLKYFVYCLKAKYWITSVNIERGLKFKKKQTKFLNTWHGTAINKMGNSIEGRNDFDWSDTDFVCYANDGEIAIYKECFNTTDENMIPTGLPRNDELYLVDEKKKQELRKKLNIPENKKVILYAPTWRDSNDFGENYVLTPPIDWEKWEKQLGDEYVFLLRTHPYTTKLMNVEFNDFVRNYTSYPSINELLMVADILISDYSSTLLDYCILERPMFCFGYDYEEYTKIRGFYYDISKELPNGVTKTEDELINQIKNIDFEEESKKTKKFKSKHVQYGGNATEICIDKMFRNK